MLKKLLKYDFAAVFKFWWIAALSSLGLSFVGILCMDVLESDADFPDMLRVMAGLGIFFVHVSIIALPILTFILIFMRFYRNFFTDEGYLTFTLPVKRTQLITSKLIVSTAAVAAAAFVCVLDYVIIYAEDIHLFTKQFWSEIRELLLALWEELGFYTVLYIAEILLLILLCIAFSCLFLFCCITVGSIIAKRAKVVTAIAVYYGANALFSTATQIFFLFGAISMADWIAQIPPDSSRMTVLLFLLGIVLFLSVCCMLLYTLQYRMLDRKLNLN